MSDPLFCTMNDCGAPANRAVVFRWFTDDTLRAALYVCDDCLGLLCTDAAEGAIEILAVSDLERTAND